MNTHLKRQQKNGTKTLNVYKMWSFRCFLILFALWHFLIPQANAQEEQMIQVRTVSEQLQPMKNMGVSINGNEYIFTGSNGAAFTELNESELPVKTITIKDEQFEVKAWNYSKSILEVVIRKKSYTLVPVIVKDQQNKPIANIPVTFSGKKITTGITKADGHLDVLLAHDETIAASQFTTTEDYEIAGLQSADNQYILTVASQKPAPTSQTTTTTKKTVIENPVVEKPITKESYLKNFDFSKIDSIQSLTMFYAIFKNYEIRSLPTNIKQKIDAKFSELMFHLQDSLRQNDESFMARISDSSLVAEDLKNLISQAKAEGLTLLFQKEEFDGKIGIIEHKLDDGITNLDEDARAALYSDLLELEMLLRENESRFYKNMNYYREIINSLKEKYFDFQSLENKLSESEARLLEEQRIFRNRLLGISAVVLVFTALILLLITFSNRLKKQKGALELANSEVKRVNEHLEEMVQARTKMLEESNRELDTFLYRASHDLRSPVCSIKGLCGIAISLSNGESKEMVQRVITITEKMDRLLTKLSIIREINHPTEYNAIPFRTMAENVLQNFRNIIDEKQVEIQISCPEDIVFHSNPRLVEVVLTNLLENALHYGALQKRDPVRIAFNAAVVNNKIEFSIQDNGIGIKESIKHRLFEMFFKGHETSQGNGLGLYIVQKSVTALKGTVDVESEKNGHTKFVVKLPLKMKPKKEKLYIASA